MKTLVKTITILVAILGIANLNAQELKMGAMETKKHEIRPFYGTAYSASSSDIFAESLVRGLLGSGEHSEFSTFGMVGLGYRYHLKRFSFGADLGYSTAKEEFFKTKKDSKPYETNNFKRIFVMPTASYSYYRKGLIDLYGATSVGIISENKKTTATTKTENSIHFAYQVTPVGLRIGNETIGGFVELGYGQKGFVNAGISLKF